MTLTPTPSIRRRKNTRGDSGLYLQAQPAAPSAQPSPGDMGVGAFFWAEEIPAVRLKTCAPAGPRAESGQPGWKAGPVGPRPGAASRRDHLYHLAPGRDTHRSRGWARVGGASSCSAAAPPGKRCRFSNSAAGALRIMSSFCPGGPEAGGSARPDVRSLLLHTQRACSRRPRSAPARSAVLSVCSVSKSTSGTTPGRLASPGSTGPGSASNSSAAPPEPLAD